MSIAVQSNIKNQSSNSGTFVCAFNSPNTAGNTILVVACFDLGSQPTLSLSDSQGNTYSTLHGPDSSTGLTQNVGFQVWRATNVNGGSNTVTLTSSPFIFGFLCILEYPAGVCDGALDQSAVASSAFSVSSLSVGPTGNSAQTGELAIAFGANLSAK